MSGNPDPRGKILYRFRALKALGTAAAAFVLVLALSAGTAFAQGEKGPFDDLSGAWSGTGSIALKSGSKERIRCKAEYRVLTRNSVRLQITCASDSYKFQLQSNVTATDGSLSGTWTETTRRVSGRIVGTVSGNRVNARAEGQTFTALFSMTTRGNRQSVSIESPGSEMAGIRITLSRRSR